MVMPRGMRSARTGLPVAFLGRQAERGALAVEVFPGVVLSLDVAQPVALDGLERQATLGEIAQDGWRLQKAGMASVASLVGHCVSQASGGGA